MLTGTVGVLGIHKRWKRYGDPLGGILWPTAEERFWAKVEKTDNHWLFTGASIAGHNGERYGSFRAEPAKAIGAHVFSWELENGPVPVGFTVDHDYRCPKICVRPTHLRLATWSQQQQNLSGARSHSKTGIRGVWWSEPRQKWHGLVKHHGERHQIYTVSFEEACEFVRITRLELFSHNDADREIVI